MGQTFVDPNLFLDTIIVFFCLQLFFKHSKLYVADTIYSFVFRMLTNDMSDL